MFKVKCIGKTHTGEIFTVYGVDNVQRGTNVIIFLLYMDNKWQWVNASSLIPITEEDNNNG